MGAWIETGIQGAGIWCAKSHPSWVRGLKHDTTILSDP